MSKPYLRQEAEESEIQIVMLAWKEVLRFTNGRRGMAVSVQILFCSSPQCEFQYDRDMVRVAEIMPEVCPLLRLLS
jgi:hypothetical protein